MDKASKLYIEETGLKPLILESDNNIGYTFEYSVWLQEKVEKLLSIPDVRLSLFEDAAKKQKHALNVGGFGHAIWCNFTRLGGDKICNCGVSDLQIALNSES